MFITCQNCNTNFIVESNQISNKGRKVKCSKCAHIWHYYKSKESSSIDDQVKESRNTSSTKINNAEPQFDEKISLASRTASLTDDLIKGSANIFDKGVNLPVRIPNNKFNKELIKNVIFYLYTVFLIISNLLLAYFLYHYSTQANANNMLKHFKIQKINFSTEEDKEKFSINYRLYNSSKQLLDAPLISLQLLDQNHKIINSHLDYWSNLKLQPDSSININTNFYRISKTVKYVNIIFGNRFYFFIQKLIVSKL